MKTYTLDLYHNCYDFAGTVKITAENVQEATTEAQRIVNSMTLLNMENENPCVLKNDME